MRQLLDEAIGVSPASKLDVDAIVVMSRRHARKRRLVAGGSGAAAIFALIAAVLLGIAALGGSRSPALPTAPTDRLGAQAYPVSTDAAGQARLSHVLADAFAVMPGLSQFFDDFTSSPRVVEVPLPAVPVQGVAETYRVDYTVTSLAGTTSVVELRSLALREPRVLSRGDATCAHYLPSTAAGVTCAATVGPEGQQTIALTLNDLDRITHLVIVYWPTATVVLMAHNFDPADPTQPLLAPEPIIDLAELTEVAGDPRLVP
jgi:hypothetical protein